MKAFTSIAALTFCVVAFSPAFAQGDAAAGARDFQVCASCHSLEPNRNMTGPSLSDVIGRKAGGLKSFERYSPAVQNPVSFGPLKRSTLGSPTRHISFPTTA